MKLNNQTIIGNIGREIEKDQYNGKPLVRFSVAHTERTQDENGNWSDAGTTWVRCTAWENLARKIAANITPGQAVLVTGRMTFDQWETKEGGTAFGLSMTVSDIGPSLRMTALPGNDQAAQADNA